MWRVSNAPNTVAETDIKLAQCLGMWTVSNAPNTVAETDIKPSLNFVYLKTYKKIIFEPINCIKYFLQ